jgi:hypothetical protein
VTLADLIRKPNPDAMIARLVTEHEDALQRQKTLGESWASAVADEAEGAGNSAEVARLEQQLDVANRQVSRSAAALRVAQGRQVAGQEQASQAALTKRWDEAVHLAEARQALVSKLADSAKNLAADFKALQDLTAKIYTTLPACPDLDGALLREPHLQGLLTRELRRLGFEGAGPAAVLWDSPALPEVFKGVPGLIHQWRLTATSKR